MNKVLIAYASLVLPAVVHGQPGNLDKSAINDDATYATSSKCVLAIPHGSRDSCHCRHANGDVYIMVCDSPTGPIVPGGSSSPHVVRTGTIASGASAHRKDDNADATGTASETKMHHAAVKAVKAAKAEKVDKVEKAERGERSKDATGAVSAPAN